MKMGVKQPVMEEVKRKSLGIKEEGEEEIREKR